MLIALQSSSSRKKPPPRVPDGVRIYAIGDIHGRADLLEDMFKRIDADLASNPIAHRLCAIAFYMLSPALRGIDAASRAALDWSIEPVGAVSPLLEELAVGARVT